MRSLKTYLLILASLPAWLFAQDKKTEALFKKTCTTIALTFARQDLKTLNRYVNNANGVYVITRPGAIDAVVHYDSLNIALFSAYPYKDATVTKKLSLKYGAAPKYDCGTEKWNKKGFYADSTHYTRLSELMEFLSKNGMGNYSAVELEKTRSLESKSRKIVYTELAKKHGIVFYLTLINKKWYLIVIDTVASDCSA